MQFTKFLILVGLLNFLTPSPTFSTVLPDTSIAPQSRLITADSVRKDAKNIFGGSISLTVISGTFWGMSVLSKGTALVIGLLYGAAGSTLIMAIAGLIFGIKRWRYAKKIKQPCRECTPQQSKRSKLIDALIGIWFLFLGVTSLLGALALDFLKSPLLAILLFILGCIVAILGLVAFFYFLKNLKR